jgi:response regulator RpfG family c-di-GMP phosphodiesterase
MGLFYKKKNKNKVLSCSLNGPLVFLVDDSLTLLEVIKRILLREGYRVATFQNPKHALKMSSDLKPHVLLSDYQMPNMNGVELIKKIKKTSPKTVCILMSGILGDRIGEVASKIGVSFFIQKPWRRRELLDIIWAASEFYWKKNEFPPPIQQNESSLSLYRYLKPKEIKEPKILFVDDEEPILHALERVFLEEKYKIFTALSGKKGLSLFKQHNINVVVADQKMPEMNGLEFLSYIKRLNPKVPRLVLTGCADLSPLLEAEEKGEIDALILKPWDDNKLMAQIKSVLER